MLKSFRQFFQAQIQAGRQGEVSEHALHIATAALLIEMMRMDESIHADEQVVVIAALRRKFGLDDAACAEIIALAEAETHQAASYYEFTRLINEHFSSGQKIQVIEYLWEVAYADDRLDIHEEHLVRKLSELLHVPHREFIAAKHRVLERREQ